MNVRHPTFPQSLALALTLAASTLAPPPAAAGPLPAEGAWQTGSIAKPASENVDRIFLVNRGWVEGRLTKIDPTAVSFQAEGEAHTFPRADVSVMQLGGWLSPEKRMDKQEVKVRIVCEGESEIGSLVFTRGTIISEVDSPPAFTVGRDSDDKLSSTRTGIDFEKGLSDRSVTTFTCDVTLLVPTLDSLSCELLLARANSFAGSLTVRFLNPADGKELISLRQPAKELWNRFEVPLSKLKPGSLPFKVDCLGSNEITTRNIQAIPPSPAPPTLKDVTAARLCLIDSKQMTGRLLSLDEYSVRMQIGMGQAVLVPRGRIACIELHDWEAAYRAGKPGADLTPPLIVSFAGSSAESLITLPATESIAQLITPPHYVSGWDHNDFASVRSERSFGFEKTVLDRSPTQVEATVVLRVTSKSGTELGVSNAFTNVWGGDLRVSIFNALTKRGVEISGTPTQTTVSSRMKIARGKLIPQ